MKAVAAKKSRGGERGVVALGIDPGTRRVGYGVIKAEGGSLVFVAAGILSVNSSAHGSATDDAAALASIRGETKRLIKKYRPSSMGIERLFFSKNRKTAMAVAQARGAVLIAAQEESIPVKEYGPNEVKLGVTGYGSADKKAVLKMVRLMLGKHDLKVIDDASDALALAIMASGK